jgi:8-oxo-dGTP pyrophosphatase MutT (NUDIX family)
VYRGRVFDVLRDTCVSPRTGDEHEFHLLECCDWVNVVPITPDDQVVLIRQFRHGVRDFSLEIPGGLIDPEDPSPLHAGRRELREETGYDSDDLVSLGWSHPNPALQGNRCHTFLARGVRKVGEPRLDGTEETEVVLVPRADLPELVQDGRIKHALVVVAFYLLGLPR